MMMMMMMMMLMMMKQDSGFPLSEKTNTFKFQFDQDKGLVWKPAKSDGAPSVKI